MDKSEMFKTATDLLLAKLQPHMQDEDFLPKLYEVEKEVMKEMLPLMGLDEDIALKLDKEIDQVMGFKGDSVELLAYQLKAFMENPDPEAIAYFKKLLETES